MSDAAVCAGAEEVLERYAATVFAAAYAMVKNKEDAEDIAQEVFISYVKAKPAFESAEHEKAWLLRVTINRCKSFFRSAWQRKTTGLEIGMPASGKSTVGVLLAKRLGYSFVDVDIVIQEKEGRLLKEIIAEEGLGGFMEVE